MSWGGWHWGGTLRFPLCLGKKTTTYRSSTNKNPSGMFHHQLRQNFTFFPSVFFSHRENGGKTLGMGALNNQPHIHLIARGNLLGISPFKGLLGGLKQLFFFSVCLRLFQHTPIEHTRSAIPGSPIMKRNPSLAFW